MQTVKVSKRFTVNMGNYESYAPEFLVEVELDPLETPEEAIKRATRAVDRAAFEDLTEAAEITNIKDSFILTWLHNRR